MTLAEHREKGPTRIELDRAGSPRGTVLVRHMSLTGQVKYFLMGYGPPLASWTMSLTSVPSGAIPWMEDSAWALTTSTAAFSARSHRRVALHRWKPGREGHPLERRHLCGFCQTSPFQCHLNVPKCPQPYHNQVGRLVSQEAGRDGSCQGVMPRAQKVPRGTQHSLSGPGVHRNSVHDGCCLPSTDWEQKRGTGSQDTSATDPAINNTNSSARSGSKSQARGYNSVQGPQVPHV